MKTGISTSCLYPELTEVSFLKVAQAHPETCEIFFNALTELDKKFVKILLDIQKEYGQTVTSVHPTMSLAEPYMLFSAYDRRLSEGLDQFKRYAEITAQLGGKYVILHGGKVNRVLDNRGYFERFSLIAEAVRQNGACLLQENVVKFRAGNIDVLTEMADYLGDSAAFCLDIKQSIRGGYSPFDVMERLGKKIKHIHISDNREGEDCMLPFSGTFDFEKFFTLAKNKGYEGDAILEVYDYAYRDLPELFASYEKIRKKFENFA